MKYRVTYIHGTGYDFEAKINLPPRGYHYHSHSIQPANVLPTATYTWVIVWEKNNGD